MRRAIASFFVALLLLPAQVQLLQAQEPAPEASAEKSSTEEAPAEPAPKEEGAAESPATVPTTVNREKVAPDEEGRIQFNYVGQPWMQVLQDFADAAGYSLDWQELPSDALNLTTQRTYTPKEAHDLMNRHLLARGFTMLVEGEVLSIVKVDKLDPSLVPRAEADELEDFAPHDFMRVTFDVPLSMDPAKAAEDVKILLSPNAKVTPLLASRRLLVIDAVINLRDVRSLMYAEQKEDKEAGQPREFVLKYHRADYVAEQVLVVLGLDPNVIKTPDELKLETQRIQLQMKLAEKAKDVSKMIKSDGPKVHIAVNRRRNSILVNAPAKLMLLVERTVKQLDVSPEDGAEGEMALTLKQYQLVMVDPGEITKSLEDSGQMDPRSRLQSYPSSKTLLATATQADHEKILAIIKQLDVTMPATIEAGELGGQQPHDFVRVRFRMPFGMSPSEMATKVQPLLSENAKVLSLATSRELLIVDTVEKLLEARELVTAEMDAFAAKDSLQEFVMQHRRAEVVAGRVLGMLGLSGAGLSAPAGAKYVYQGMSLFVTVNTKSNSFRVNAHPDLLKLIEGTVKQFDIPETTEAAGDKPAQTLVLYQVTGQNISSLIKMLREIGGVGPLARLQTGPAAGTLYAIAGAEDHGKIRSFLDTIAPETIKTVEAASLESLPPQGLVRVRFQLPLSATVTTVAAGLRGITTSRGIVQSLESSKQIIVLDTAENLINIREVVNAEKAALETQSVIKEFPLEHRSASEMVEQVLAMLGFDPATVSSPYQLRTELQAMKLFITANQQRNSLMVNAAPDKLKLIEEIVKQLDVPQAGLQEGDADRLSMVPYKVTGQDVTIVVKTLQEIGNLSPRTRLQGDLTSQTLYAYANPVDHEVIRKFVDKTNPNSIRRVEADKLEEYASKEKVRVRFQLPLAADVALAATQIRGILGTTGQVQTLEASKQLIVDGTVANLIEIRDVLRAENEAITALDVFREFRVEHRRAEEIAEQILTMLELSPTTISSPRGARYTYRGMKLFVSIKSERNSIVVGARQELLEMVEQIVKQFDVPEDHTATEGAGAVTMVMYNAPGQNITSVIEMLRKLAELGPLARIDTGPSSETLYAIANKADHEKIRVFLEKIAPEPIRTVTPEKLDSVAPQELVRVRFQLPHSADVTTLATQLRGLTTAQGIVQSLESSKQIIVLDTAENLMSIRSVLEAESAALAEQNNIREFPLQHRRATEMVEQVLTMLGLDPATITYPAELRLELQKMKLFITANQQRNSLMVNAAADKLELVEKIIKQLDVPEASGASTEKNQLTLVPYKVRHLDVTSAEKALREIAGIGPTVRLQGDPSHQTLYAYATKADHEKIEQFLAIITEPGGSVRIDPDKLEEHEKHERGRVRFQLPLTADVVQSAAQIRGLLGEEGIVQPLEASKQLIVSGSVETLLEVRDVLEAEAVARKSENNIREFPLKHRRAQDMVKQVLTMLGVSPELSTNPRQMQAALKELKLFITTNELRNSLVINAPAEKMLTVEQIVKQLDVPIDAIADDSAAPKIIASKQTMVSYQIASGDVTSLLKALEEIGNLNPRTRLQGDPASKTLYAYANKSDHQKIRQFVDEMDPNIVRRVHPDELEDNPAHEVVRAIFQLPLSSDIDSASRQIQGVLGIGARVQSLDSSKQLVVVDTVANLIDVRDLLYGEQLAAKALEMPLVFPLEHRRASYVADQVMILLGLDPSARKTSAEVQFEAQRMQMMQQSGQSSGKMADQTVYIAVNRRQNSLLVNTPPEKAPLIERTIEQIDVPVENGNSMTMGQLTMDKYQTITADTDSVIGALEELGNLDPKTQLQSDSTGKVIYAYATVADHATIKKMIARLDGTGRRPEVRWLPPHLPAKQMAGTIMELIVAPVKKKENNLPWYYYRNRDDDKEDDRNDGFRALADVENNRLLLWATEAEMEEVDNLIEKLSERSDGTFNDRRKVRRLELRDPEATRKLLEQLRSTWSGENRLEIAPPPAEAKPKEKEEEPADKEEDKLTGVIRFSPRFSLQPTWLAQVVAEPAQDEPQAEVKATANSETVAAPPIKITVNEKGEIILASEDTEALDRLQMLIEQLSPVQTEFKSFQLHYISVIDVVYNLENYFEEEMSEGKGEEILDWWGRQQKKTPEPGPLTLGKRPPIRFIDDVKTNTLLVANASSSQLRVVEEMIKLYDQPPNPELYYQRRTEAIKIKYSEATDIANSLKEVYRDLLSSKDKEFRTEEGKSAVALSRESSYVFGDARDVINGVESPVLVRFSGALAIGVDEISNSVVISAREAVLEEIKDTITKLDRAAMPKTVVRVHSANGVLDADDLRQIIAETLSKPWIGGKPGGISTSSKSRSKVSKSKKRSTRKKRSK